MTAQLGQHIIDHFEAPASVGKNINGVEIDYLFLSIEVTPNYDNSINRLASNNGFEVTALDATQNRNGTVRSGFSYFRGVAMTGSPGSLDFADRRRIVVIDNTVAGKPIIRHNDLPLSSGALGNANIAAIRDAINVAAPPASGASFETWRDGFVFPAGQDGELADADGDCASNLLEFFAGTDPVDLLSAPMSGIEKDTEGLFFRYRAANNRTGISHRLQIGPLDNFTDYSPLPEEITMNRVSETIDEFSVRLPPEARLFLRQVVILSPPAP